MMTSKFKGDVLAFALFLILILAILFGQSKGIASSRNMEPARFPMHGHYLLTAKSGDGISLLARLGSSDDCEFTKNQVNDSYNGLLAKKLACTYIGD
jgi:hypothetical protein